MRFGDASSCDRARKKDAEGRTHDDPRQGLHSDDLEENASCRTPGRAERENGIVVEQVPMPDERRFNGASSGELLDPAR